MELEEVARSTASLTLQLISMQEMETSQLPPVYIAPKRGR